LKIFRENSKILRITGNDRKDFFNRVSTNDFRKFGEDEVLRTVFSNDIGRVVDFAPVINLQNDFLVLCSNGNSGNLIDFIQKYTVTDDISAELLSIEKITVYTDKIVDLRLFDDFAGKNYKSLDGNIFVKDDYAFRKVFIILNNPDSYYIKNLLSSASSVTEKDFSLHALRNGYLYSCSELNTNVNPLECNLIEYVSFTKGCYIGQEIISRLDTQDKVQKEIVRIISDSEFSGGQKIFSEAGTECGIITSAIQSEGKFEGLGFVKKSFLKYPQRFNVENVKEKYIEIKIFQ
jgi:tRNA-modifying protein YgfZ